MAGSAKPSNSSIAIGLRLKKAREKKYSRAVDAAEQFGSTQQRWSLMETGKVVFDSELIFRLSAFLSVSPAWLLTGHEITSNPVSEVSAGDEFLLDLSSDVIDIGARLFDLQARLNRGLVRVDQAKSLVATMNTLLEKVGLPPKSSSQEGRRHKTG